jgi:hypothetical protein
MTAISPGPTSELRREFSRAGMRLAAARAIQAGRDTPVNRATVATLRAHIDTVLDMYLGTRRPLLPRAGGPAA